MLQPLRVNEFTTRDSFRFSDDIRKQNANLFVTPFNLDSLFTNIALNETIDICVNKLYQHNNMKVNYLCKQEFRSLFKLATKETLFMFNNHCYRQIDGVVMGSPLGLTLANIFLCQHEEQWLESCPTQFKHIYFKRYVDDLFCLL